MCTTFVQVRQYILRQAPPTTLAPVVQHEHAHRTRPRRLIHRHRHHPRRGDPTTNTHSTCLTVVDPIEADVVEAAAPKFMAFRGETGEP